MMDDMTSRASATGCACCRAEPAAGLSRRTVLTAAGAAGAVGLLAACGGGGGADPVAEATSSPDDEVIVDLETLRSEGAVMFQTSDGEAIAVEVDGAVRAFSRRCTHEGCSVGWDAGEQVLSCPCHGSRFDPNDEGAVLRGPARSPLPAVAVVVDEAEGVLRRG
jgi:cytochrome b6-f complex iron-sulfur subunit